MTMHFKTDSTYLYVELHVTGERWVGMGFGKAMVNTNAVIGVSGSVQLYHLGGTLVSKVTPLDDAEQSRLNSTEFEHFDGDTRMSFRLLRDDAFLNGGGSTDLIFAYGYGTTLNYHEKRDIVSMVLTTA